MIWLWILGVLAALILLLCWTRVGIHVVLQRENTSVDAKIGLFHIRLLPGKERTEKAEKKPQKPKKERAAKPDKKKKALPKITLADIKDAVHTLAPPLKRALSRTRRGIRLRPLDLRMTLGGSEDPAAAAEQYGYLHAGVWTVMPVLEELLVIPDPYIHVGIDFEARETVLEGEVGISVRIGTLLAVGFGMAIPALRWFLRFQKRQKQRPKTEAAEAAAA